MRNGEKGIAVDHIPLEPALREDGAGATRLPSWFLELAGKSLVKLPRPFEFRKIVTGCDSPTVTMAGAKDRH